MLTTLFLTTAFLISAAPAGAPADEHLQRYRESRPGMGSTFEIIAYAPDEPTARRGLDAAFARIEELNQIFSDYDSESEACRLSHAAPMPEAVPVSAEMFAVLDYSIQLSRQTDGAFDVTVGPVSRLWRRARRQKQLPAPERLREAMAGVGHRHLQLDAGGRKARLAAAGMRLDFGAVAVGFAADEALAVLKQHGLTRVLVNGSGDMALGDPPPGETGWRIGVGSPSAMSPLPAVAIGALRRLDFRRRLAIRRDRRSSLFTHRRSENGRRPDATEQRHGDRSQRDGCRRFGDRRQRAGTRKGSGTHRTDRWSRLPDGRCRGRKTALARVQRVEKTRGFGLVANEMT